MDNGKLFVISGCSGVGKSSVLKLVMKARQDLQFSVSVTTRAPRNNERDGVDYHFITREAFDGMVQRGELMEYDNHHSAGYGTERRQVLDKLSQGHVILDIDPAGAFQVRAERPDVTLIFITPPSLQELERRLRDRKDTTEEQIQIRMGRAPWEMEQSARYDYVVVNHQEQQCADEILKIIADKVNEE